MNRFGSMCMEPHSRLEPTTITDYYKVLPTGPPPIPAPHSGPQQNISLFTTSDWQTALSNTIGSISSESPSASSLALSGQTYTPLPNQSATRCQDPVCPSLNNALCIDDAGTTYGITCDSSIVGLVAFPPRVKKRRFAGNFTDCLAICDQEPGCLAADWDEQSQNCVIYGQVTGHVSKAGKVAARKVQSLGGQGYGSV